MALHGFVLFFSCHFVLQLFLLSLLKMFGLPAVPTNRNDIYWRPCGSAVVDQV